MVASAGTKERKKAFLSRLSTTRVGLTCALVILIITVVFINSGSVYRGMQSPLHLLWIAIHGIAIAAIIVIVRLAQTSLPRSAVQASTSLGWRRIMWAHVATLTALCWLAATHTVTDTPLSLHQLTFQTMPVNANFIAVALVLLSSLIYTTHGVLQLIPKRRTPHKTPSTGDRVDWIFLSASGLALTASLFFVAPPHFIAIDESIYWTTRGAIGLIMLAAIVLPARRALEYRAEQVPYLGPLLTMQLLHVMLIAAVMQNWRAHAFGLAAGLCFLLALSRYYRSTLGEHVFSLRLHAFFPEVLSSLAVGGIIITSWHTSLLIDQRVESALLAGATASILVFGLLRYTRLEIRQYRNVNELASIVDQVYRESRQDPLTLLGNRSALQEDLEEILNSQQQQEAVTLFFIDLDHFKRINDSFGHQAGDDLLQMMANRLRNTFGSCVYRLGGDEFVALRTDLSREATQSFMDAAYDELTEKVELLGTELQPSFSIGIARSEQRSAPEHTSNSSPAKLVEVVSPEALVADNESATSHVDAAATRHAVHNFWSSTRQSDGPKRILQRADLALYRAKELGRNRYVEYDPSFKQDVKQRHEHTAKLRAAIADGSLTLESEPVVQPGTGTLRGEFHTISLQVEDSMWKWPYLHSLALENGFLHELFIAKLSLVAAHAQQSDQSFWHGIEFSRQELTHPKLWAALTHFWADADLAPQQCKVQISEHLMQAETCRSAMQGLTHLGYEVCVCDFGSAPSSILNLAEYPATSLMWSPQIIEQLGRSEATTAVVAAVGDLAAELSINWGGVEVSEDFQFDMLQDLQADFVAGPWIRQLVENDTSTKPEGAENGVLYI